MYIITMIKNMYAVTDGPHVGQGLIIIEQRSFSNQITYYNGVLWPSAKAIVVSDAEVAEYDLLEQLPDEVFDAYQKAYQHIITKHIIK